MRVYYSIRGFFYKTTLVGFLWHIHSFISLRKSQFRWNTMFWLLKIGCEHHVRTCWSPYKEEKVNISISKQIRPCKVKCEKTSYIKVLVWQMFIEMIKLNIYALFLATSIIILNQFDCIQTFLQTTQNLPVIF